MAQSSKRFKLSHVVVSMECDKSLSSAAASFDFGERMSFSLYEKSGATLAPMAAGASIAVVQAQCGCPCLQIVDAVGYTSQAYVFNAVVDCACSGKHQSPYQSTAAPEKNGQSTGGVKNNDSAMVATSAHAPLASATTTVAAAAAAAAGPTEVPSNATLAPAAKAASGKALPTVPSAALARGAQSTPEPFESWMRRNFVAEAGVEMHASMLTVGYRLAFKLKAKPSLDSIRPAVAKYTGQSHTWLTSDAPGFRKNEDSTVKGMRPVESEEIDADGDVTVQLGST